MKASAGTVDVHREALHRPRKTVPRQREATTMIRLAHLNNQPLVVNSDLIKFIENTQDTVLILITGEKVVVLETIEEVLERVVSFRRQALTARVGVPPQPNPFAGPPVAEAAPR